MMNSTQMISHMSNIFSDVGTIYLESMEFRVGIFLLFFQFSCMLFVTLLVSSALNRPQVCYFASCERQVPCNVHRVD